MLNQILDLEVKGDAIVLDHALAKELGEWGGKLKGYFDGQHLIIVPAGTPVDPRHAFISQYANISGGEPVIMGTRVTVRAIVEYERLYHSPAQILRALPHLTPEQIADALGYYADHPVEIDAYIAENETAYTAGTQSA